MGYVIAICIAVVVLGIPFTIWWWKVADQWFDAERKRFGRKEEEPDPNAGAQVIRGFNKDE